MGPKALALLAWPNGRPCSPDNCQVSAWMQGKLLQVPSLVELSHDARIMDKFNRTRVPLVEEHIGNVPGGEAAEEDAPRRACPLTRSMQLLNRP
ncbi:hypothetical protein QL285_026344 [Trifolium repens]|jgi:hypothetical protein|nr:hypothetical protein QL285_026344 [Trifolium repens]